MFIIFIHYLFIHLFFNAFICIPAYLFFYLSISSLILFSIIFFFFPLFCFFLFVTFYLKIFVSIKSFLLIIAPRDDDSHNGKLDSPDDKEGTCTTVHTYIRKWNYFFYIICFRIFFLFLSTIFEFFQNSTFFSSIYYH